MLFRSIHYINHIHISEIDLKPIENKSFHHDFSQKLKEIKYDKIITYEVNECEGFLPSISTFSKIYN